MIATIATIAAPELPPGFSAAGFHVQGPGTYPSCWGYGPWQLDEAVNRWLDNGRAAAELWATAEGLDEEGDLTTRRCQYLHLAGVWSAWRN